MKGILIIAGFTIAAGFGLSRSAEQTHSNNSYRSFALLELYTSEGCSSCPSADRLLPQLGEIDSNIISLSFHVDYWDQLGWKDRFSNADFTNRQRAYQEQLQLESIYTPQLIINGQYELVGSNRPTAETDIRKALNEKASVQLAFDNIKKENDKLKINCHAEGNLRDQNIFLALVQKYAETNVKAGENHGIKLSHINIVRSLTKKAAQQKLEIEIPFPKDLADNNWLLVLFSQDKKDLKITGANRDDR